MTTNHIGRIVVGSLAAGFITALGLVVGPAAGAEEHVITGMVLLAFALGWAMLAALSTRTKHPQGWAVVPAGFMGVAGAALLAFAPGDGALGALGWVWPPLLLALLGATVLRVRVALHSRTRRWVVYPLLMAYALCAVGGGYESVRDSLDRRIDSPHGQVIDVGGHRLHVHCTGSGSPAVILESGLGESGAYWGWITAAVAGHTTVCAYDRAGRGWSEPAPVAQDAFAVARDLAVLLERAHLEPPFVLVGHSSGAQYVRVFAGRYPERLAGVVLLDGQPAEAFEDLPGYPAAYAGLRRISALLPSLARVGLGRVVPGGDWSARAARSLRDEVAQLPTSLAQARSFQSLGDRPLIVVTAAQGALAGWLPLQDRMATLSTNSSHRVVPFTHDAIINDRAAAQASSHAILDVVDAVRSGARLKASH